MHYHFQHQTERFAHLFRVGRIFFAHTLTQAVEALEEATLETQNPIFKRGQAELRKIRESKLLFQTLESLPVTLTHGDMHPTNMIRLSDGRTVLLDWGNARLAPAMLDIANLIPMGSKSWNRYLKAWRKISGSPLDSRTAELGYHWGTVMVNTMYLPHAVRYATPEHVEKMAEREIKKNSSYLCPLLRHFHRKG